ncbi:MAG TPA: lamin tail domain-containing protein [Anaeromyxobacter sp.]|nr:lamin tail domain-containing protein [Anaeromyxobacter sp.]
MIGRVGLAALAAALACGPRPPDPLPRVVGASPSGEGVPTTTATEIRFDAPVDPAGLVDGRLLVLATAEVLRAAVSAVEGDAGAAGLAGTVAVDASVVEDGRAVALRPRAPLRGWTGYAIVLSSRVRAADGRPVLDPEGRRRTFVASFGTGPPEGPPPTPAITEVLADAETPEAGGEYVEIANLGWGALDLGGFRLAKHTAAGALVSCEVVPPPGAVLPPGGVGLVAGGAWDGRYALPTGVPVMTCGATALLGGIANDRAPDLVLADPAGHVLATFGAGGGPVCPFAAEKGDIYAADEPTNIVCTDGSPGVLP